MRITDDLLISYLQGEVTDEEAVAVEKWLSEDITHRRKYSHFKILWETSLQFGFEEEIDVKASLDRFRQKRAVFSKTKTKADARGRNYFWLKVAAAIFLVSSLVWLLFNQFPVRQTEFLTMETVKTDTLSDGSVVTLNKNSRLLYPEKFSGKIRQVWLSKGEAFFKVSPDRTRPFLIHTGKTVVKVVGTTFNVKNKRGLIEIIVETGIVLVGSNGQVVSLQPGEKVRIQSSGSKMIKEHVPDHLYAYYRSKEFVAEDTPLWRMVQVLNEAYDSQVIIGRNELRALPLNTTFKDESLEDILQVICKTFNLKIEKKNNRIILY